MKKTVLFIVAFFTVSVYGSSFLFKKGATLQVNIPKTEEAVVYTALDLFSKDFNTVFQGSIKFTNSNNSSIFIGTLGHKSLAEKKFDRDEINQLSKTHEGFIIKSQKNQLYILGSDKRGTAYGILELSRIIGISPWEWWADVHPEPKEELVLTNYYSFQSPAVKYRGIFLNDEDWGLTPWSFLTYEPSEKKGEIGPKTHAKIFELLLRLRANAFWPAMHDCSVPFYFTKGNKEMADKYGIVLGTSHCEPMMRNTNAEWNVAGKGDYNYLTNRKNILNFWENRVKELKKSDNIYTVGIRGVHDGSMQGAKTVDEQKEALTRVLSDQRKMLATLLKKEVHNIPQVFIPYKEVLDVYNKGLYVPEDITLMWCDDNYGYIRHFPNELERTRKGGNGVYYHISYWGRPHDYLWLSTNHPALTYTQMKWAYEYGAQDYWILNVGDIKPAEYQIELFLDLAWDIESIENSKEGLETHLRNWISREFGKEYSEELVTIFNEYYRLAFIRKPEFMGNTRTEESNSTYSVVSDLPWSKRYIYNRLNDYNKIANRVKVLSNKIKDNKKEAWYQLVEYPILAANEMNKKHLFAQLARHGLESWEKSNLAYHDIIKLTDKYNSLNNGKWNHMMDYQPRRLPVFKPVESTKATSSLVENKEPLLLFNGTDYAEYKGDKPIFHGLGYQSKAITLEPNSEVSFIFETSNDSVEVEMLLIPNHPIEGNLLRYAITIDQDTPQTIEYQTIGRSEEWKRNVLTNHAIRKTKHILKKKKTHTILVRALDKGVIIDQIKIW